MMLIRRASLLAVVLASVAGAALADPVTLKANPVDDDGRVTLGDIFDGAGAAADVVVANRTGPSVVLEAGQLQAQARQAGLDWSNPDGLRRVAVRRGGGASPAASGPIAAPAARIQARAEQVIRRNDTVRVSYEVGGVSLTVMGKAMRDANAGEPVAVMNTTSNRMIDAVAVGPGQAVAGPQAQQLRASAFQQFAAR